MAGPLRLSRRGAACLSPREKGSFRSDLKEGRYAMRRDWASVGSVLTGTNLTGRIGPVDADGLDMQSRPSSHGGHGGDQGWQGRSRGADQRPAPPGRSLLAPRAPRSSYGALVFGAPRPGRPGAPANPARDGPGKEPTGRRAARRPDSDSVTATGCDRVGVPQSQRRDLGSYDG